MIIAYRLRPGSWSARPWSWNPYPNDGTIRNFVSIVWEKQILL